jgi:HAD superfamily hydrolase (TIGR01549 family)
MKYWVFDLDGTLVDSFGPYFEIMAELLGEPLTRVEKQKIIGMHPSQVFSEYMPAEEIELALRELQKRSQTDATLIPTFGALKEVLAFITKQGSHVAVWTSRDLHSARAILANTGLNTYVDHLVSGDCVALKKPHPEGLQTIMAMFECESHEVVMVGDHDHDMLAGRKMDVFSVRASWHNHWDDGECMLANKQFFCDQKFSQWISESFSRAEIK